MRLIPAMLVIGHRVCVLATLNPYAYAWQQASSDPEETRLKAEVQRQTQDSPSYTDALRDLGRWYLEKRRFTDAEPLLEKALAITAPNTAIPSPTRAAAYIDVGDLYHAMQEQEGAEPDWRHLATLNYYRAVALIGADNTLAWANATVKMAGSFGPPHPDDDFTAFLAARLSRALAITDH